MVNVANQCLGAVWCVAPGTPIGGFLAGSAASGGAPAPRDCGLYTVDESGIAVIALEGYFMKWSTPPYAISATRIRRAIWAARLDERVRGIMLAIDSPGGVVAGAVAAADEVRAAVRFGPKPIHGFIEDLGAGSSYLLASGCGRLSASTASRIGGLGLSLPIHDTSGAYEKEGIKVFPVSTGPYKGAGAPGTVVTPQHVAYFSELIGDIGLRIFSTLAKGRLLTEKQRAAVRSGKVWEAGKAADMGLIDAVESFDSALRRLRIAAADRASRSL